MNLFKHAGRIFVAIRKYLLLKTTNAFKHTKIRISLIHKYGLRKILIAKKEGANDRNFIYARCPRCGTEHRIHRLSASRDMIRCSSCRRYFVVNKAPAEEAAFMRAFGKQYDREH